MIQKRNWTLRCMWVPAHIGMNAPLRAVWIKTPLRCTTFGVNVATTAAEGDSWAFAA